MFGCAARGAETNVFLPNEKPLVEKTVERSLADAQKAIDGYLALVRHSTSNQVGIWSNPGIRQGDVYRVNFFDCSSVGPVCYVTARFVAVNRTTLTLSSFVTGGQQVESQTKTVTKHLTGILEQFGKHP